VAIRTTRKNTRELLRGPTRPDPIFPSPATFPGPWVDSPALAGTSARSGLHHAASMSTTWRGAIKRRGALAPSQRLWPLPLRIFKLHSGPPTFVFLGLDPGIQSCLPCG